ncbi:MAG: type III polyketide synthase [Acidobacteriota bacterium]
MTLRIAGFGTAVPPYSISQEDAAELSKSLCCESEERARLLPVLYRRTGVRKRHSVLLRGANGSLASRQSFYPQARQDADCSPTTEQRMRRYEAEAPPLALAAARRAIEDAGVDPGEFTHSVTVSCTGFNAPGLDAALIQGLGLPVGVERTHVGFMGCHGALNGLRLAASFAEADPAARVLVCAVELCSLHFYYGWDAGKIVANALFADGAGAVVGMPSALRAARDGWQAISNGTLLIPDSQDAMSWRIADHGFQMTLSPRVPLLIEQHLPDWLAGWLRQNGLSIDQVGSWAVHPGGPRILSSFSAALGLDDGALSVSREVLGEYGNMSSATVLFILERMQRRRAPRPCVAVGFGPGMVIEAMLFD